MESIPACVRKHVRLAPYASNRTGGVADYFAEPKSENDVLELFAWIKRYELLWFPLGGGSNTLLCSQGFRGVVVRLGLKRIDVEGTTVLADAGATLAVAALSAAKNSLTGLEFATVIPGTVGGAVYGNAGAYEREMKDVVTRVRYYDFRKEMILDRAGEDCDFSYRHSWFKEHASLILQAELSVVSGDIESIQATISEYRTHREGTQPLAQPSTGCVFKNPSGDHAGRLIDVAGLKGYRVGDAMVSDVHANFIVNLGEATAEDVKQVREHVKQVVQEVHGVLLEEENIIVGESGIEP